MQQGEIYLSLHVYQPIKKQELQIALALMPTVQHKVQQKDSKVLGWSV